MTLVRDFSPVTKAVDIEINSLVPHYYLNVMYNNIDIYKIDSYYVLYAFGANFKLSDNEIVEHLVSVYDNTDEEILEVTPEVLESFMPEVGPVTGKPVIYLYPEKSTNISVNLDFNGTLSYTYPNYANGWNVLATPDNEITNSIDGSEHYYLFGKVTRNTTGT